MNIGCQTPKKDKKGILYVWNVHKLSKEEGSRLWCRQAPTKDKMVVLSVRKIQLI
jgi:hypothetical protein